MAVSHDAYRHKGSGSQNVAYAVAGGLSAQSSAFGSQTYAIRVSTCSLPDGTNNGARISVGDNPTASATSALLPLNWIEYIKVGPGQKIAVLGNSAATGSVSVTELTD
jgi:hypothetical protein